MKLFLASHGVPETIRPTFIALFPNPIRTCRIAYITNAKDPYPQVEGYISQTRLDLVATGAEIVDFDLRRHLDNPAELVETLSLFDGVWLAGGNTYYLRWILQRSGFDNIIQKLLAAGQVYGGSSAGSIVAGPSLENFGLVDNADEAPELVLNGLNLVPFVIIPHWDTEGYKEVTGKIQQDFETKGIKTVPLLDGQAVVFEGETWRIV